jgi:hypothetical protein
MDKIYNLQFDELSLQKLREFNKKLDELVELIKNDELLNKKLYFIN